MGTVTGTVASPEVLRTSFRLPPKAAVGAVVALATCALVSLTTGAAGLPVTGVALELLDRLPILAIDSGLSNRQASILSQIRLPRVILGGLVGSSLAMAGSAYQGVFRNPLADPFLLGIAAGAGLGASVSMILGLDWAVGPIGALQLLAFVGALIAVAVALLIGRSAPNQTASLLLAGIASASFFTAVQTYLLSRNVDTQRSIISWLFGTLVGANWDRVVVLTFYLVICGGVLVALRRHFDVLRVGEAEATTLGLRPDRVKLIALIAASLLTAAAVSVSGLISFVGLVVPHMIRLMIGSSYRMVVPLSGVIGAAFVILADLISRSIVSPAELGIGVVTAFVGAPFFAFLLVKTKAGSL